LLKKVVSSFSRCGDPAAASCALSFFLEARSWKPYACVRLFQASHEGL
jgi:hypothetical protein